VHRKNGDQSEAGRSRGLGTRRSDCSLFLFIVNEEIREVARAAFGSPIPSCQCVALCDPQQAPAPASTAPLTSTGPLRLPLCMCVSLTFAQWIPSRRTQSRCTDEHMKGLKASPKSYGHLATMKDRPEESRTARKES